MSRIGENLHLTGKIVSLIGITSEEGIRVSALEVVNVLLASVEVVRDLSAFMIETEVFLTLEAV